jgi:hypothetical protein
MTLVDVAVGVPTFPAMEVTHDTAVPDRTVLMMGAFSAQVGLRPIGDDEILVLSTHLRTWTAAWDIEPDFAAQVWDAGLDVGARTAPPAPDATVGAWGAIGAGLRMNLLTSDWWQDVLAYGLGGHAAAGVTFGRGPVRPMLCAEADIGLRFDHWTGTVVTGGGTNTWTWHPGAARLVVLAGVELNRASSGSSGTDRK